MNPLESLPGAWAEAVRIVLGAPAHRDMRLPRDGFLHPREAGFRRSLGRLRGQRSDWRLALADGRSLHIQVFRATYRLHWDHADPRRNPLRHMIRDARLELGTAAAGLAAVVFLGVTR